MRLQKSMKIDDKEYTAKELTVEEIIDLLTGSLGGSNSQPETAEEKADEIKLTKVIDNVFGDSGKLKEFMSLALPGTSVSDLLKLAPSEINKIWEMLREVNSHFFDLAQKMELPATLLGMAKDLLTDFSSHAVDLSKRVMEEEFSNTGTLFSKKQLTHSNETG